MTSPDAERDAVAGRRRGRRGARSNAGGGARIVDYHNLRNPFPLCPVFSEDRIEAIHQNALRLLEELGIKVLLPAARAHFRAAGARVDDASEMVFIGREIVEAAIESAPKSIAVRAGASHRDLVLEPGTLTFLSGSGAPHATDLERGRRPSSLADFEELLRLIQHFDVLHMLTPVVEPQDVAVNLRHYATTRAQLCLSDKFPFVFSRGQPQVLDVFEMIRDFRGGSDDAFQSIPHCYTIINTNSPRQLDVPMAQGLIDFAANGQLSIVTPFCLMGAMAPVTVAGALTLSHAEALAAIALTQIVRRGSPICYGAFVSSVDMRSGAPAFGTPEQVRASLAAGQLARRLGLPWRCSAASAANINDAQAANETSMSAWSSVLAGATIIVHSAGWIEGGLTVSYEKLITDLENLQIFAELCSTLEIDDGELAWDALAEVQPGGHFFGAAHTMDRYKTAFYEPLIADWSNFGTWTERGGLDASARATKMWRSILSETKAPDVDGDKVAALDAFIQRRTSDGGAPPES